MTELPPTEFPATVQVSTRIVALEFPCSHPSAIRRRWKKQ